MSKQKRSFWMSQQGIVALVLIAETSYFLLIEHRQFGEVASAWFAKFSKAKGLVSQQGNEP